MTMIDQLVPPTASIRNISVRYGLIWGGISAALSLIGNLSGMDPGMPDTSTAIKLVFGLIGVAIPVWAVSTAIKQFRDNEQGGFITLGKGIGIGTLSGLVAGVVGAVWMALFLLVISPNYLGTLQDAMQANMEQKGMSSDQIEMAMKFSSWTMNPAFMAISQIIGGVIFGFLVGLIAGAIMKREQAPGV